MPWMAHTKDQLVYKMPCDKDISFIFRSPKSSSYFWTIVFVVRMGCGVSVLVCHGESLRVSEGPLRLDCNQSIFVGPLCISGARGSRSSSVMRKCGAPIL
uniref:Uncharacterized protein n=1 Tax=Eutreptiella gymnastica TaxID=73025 RepID=A0A7S4GCN0_9EUGL